MGLVNNAGKDLAELGKYIDQLIMEKIKDPRCFKDAAAQIGISPAELFALRMGSRTSPDPNYLQVIAEWAGGDYLTMLKLAGYIPSNVEIQPISENSWAWIVNARIK